ncbi:amidase [Bradyrhizobium japonicum]|uniref:amidase n=1 Tax=Bradyrhizobium japonicum TaxID=375 RepID=UPI002011EB29|nr:amidase [Bradyrhizobium japonicum]
MSSFSEDLLNHDARALSLLIHQRKISCREVMAATLARIGRINPEVTAIVSLRDAESLLGEADARDRMLAEGRSMGWMHGLPQAPKDLADAFGFVTTSGSPLFASHRPSEDSLFVRRLREAGAILIGKTNTSEFGLGSQTYNRVFGATGNAYYPALTAGGSSGGAAAALALRLLPVADGSDMMGSLRNPAAYNNVFGFRPSMGRVPHGPSGDLFFQQLGYDGPMARNVADLALLLSTMAGPDPRAPLSLREPAAACTDPLVPAISGKRIAWLGDLGGHLAMEPGILDLCERALRELEGLGAIVEPIALGFSPDALWSTWQTLRSFLVAGKLGPLYADPQMRAQLKPEAIFEIECGLALSGADVFVASQLRSDWYRHVLTLHERFDVLALPSAQVFPFARTMPWPREIAGRAMDTYHRWMEVVVPATLAGVPAIGVPVGFAADGRPMGMQMLGRPAGDLELLGIAHAYDLATRWPDRHLPRLLSDVQAADRQPLMEL